MACGQFVSPTSLSIGGTVDVDIVAQTLAALTVQQAPPSAIADLVVSASGENIATNGASASIVPANAARRLVMITNTDSVNAVNLAFGVAATDTSMIYLAPLATFVMEVNQFGEMFRGEITAWGLGADVDLRFVDFGI